MKHLKRMLPKKSGRGFKGQIAIRHQGGRMKRYLRVIDWRQDKREVWGQVESLEYDPNRNAQIALVMYSDGDRRYSLAPLGLKIGQKVLASSEAPLEAGNALPLGKIPAGTQVYNLEITPGKGAQLVRGAGNVAVVMGKEKDWVTVRLPSGELRRFSPKCFATLGQVGNLEIAGRNLKTAGRKRRLGIRPTVRGVAMHPKAHPHGGGEGRSSVGLKYPKTPWGKPAVGKTRNKRKYSNRLIIEARKKGKHS